MFISDHTLYFFVQEYEDSEAPECGNASLHGAGRDILEHPDVSVVKNLWVTASLIQYY